MLYKKEKKYLNKINLFIFVLFINNNNLLILIK